MAKRSCRAAIIPVTPQYNLLSWRVLVVEDDPLMQLGIRQLLNEYSELSIIEIVANGYLGIEAALRHHPDLILMDVNMPEMNGYEACKQLKTLRECQNIPVLFLSSDTDEGHIQQGLDAGGIAHIAKPFKLPLFLDGMKQLLGHSMTEAK